ncbi:hypothetical protein N2603_43205 [Bradyrhizobium huanghuaihaiense]|uniref:hypothetical protein n=1 Tax=Bradyrhizobium huanghuaihaiense TaxID=990078 RepID=UPI0021A9F987|nr:hypothetical protein [Bradyrhizobium sp. CB3035]UWU76597.1 hypothetical protein N2603_43205 [Bradyrhizobium sp. CB3035]
MQQKHKQHARGQGRRDRRPGAEDAFSYWRQLPPNAFDRRRRANLANGISKIGSIFPEWQAAIAGDAGAVVGIVLRLRPPFRISGRVDLAMSLLLNCAFENASAALVLSHALRRMHLARIKRTGLAESWLAHHHQLARSRGKTGIASGGRRKPRASHDPARVHSIREGEIQPVYDHSGDSDDAA